MCPFARPLLCAPRHAGMLQEIDCNDLDFPFEAAGGLCKWCEC